MNIDQAISERGDATLCVSLSSRPGKTGMAMHNAGYSSLNLNWKYVACAETDIGRAMDLVREHNVRGASISMPFKEQVIDHLDIIDDVAATIGSVNTVVNQGGLLYGYNTDLDGCFSAIHSTANLSETTVVVLGTGGMAKTMIYALKNFWNPKQVIVAARSITSAMEVAAKYDNVDVAPWENIPNAGMLINCTPLGMNNEQLPVRVEDYPTFIECVVKLTPSYWTALSAKNRAVSGQYITLMQAYHQFQLYTLKEPPLHVLDDALSNSI